MTQDVYRYKFAPQVPLDEVEATLLLANWGAESLHGESQVRLDAAQRHAAVETLTGDAAMFQQDVVVELPYPPSINHYWRRAGSRILISREGRRFRSSVVAILVALQLQPLVGALEVEVEIHPPDNRQRDIDNVQKALLDALQHGGAYADDAQIVRLSISKCPPVPGGKTIVRIRAI